MGSFMKYNRQSNRKRANKKSRGQNMAYGAQGMADAKIQCRAWHKGEQERQGGGGLGQVIDADMGQDRLGHCV